MHSDKSQIRVPIFFYSERELPTMMQHLNKIQLTEHRVGILYYHVIFSSGSVFFLLYQFIRSAHSVYV